MSEDNTKLSAVRATVHGYKTSTVPGDPWHEVEVRRLHDFHRWSEGWKRSMGFLAGLKVLEWRKDSYGDPPRRSWALTIAARHWPHLLCWQWFLELRPQRGMPWERRHFFSFHPTYGERGWTLRVLWLLQLYYATQRYDWMVAEPFKAQAPLLYPLHEGEARTQIWEGC